MLTKCGGEARNRGMLCLSVFPCKRGMKRYLAGMGTSSAILGCAAVPDVPFPSDSSVLFYTGKKSHVAPCPPETRLLRNFSAWKGAANHACALNWLIKYSTRRRLFYLFLLNILQI